MSVILRNNYYPLNYNNNCFWPLPEYRRLKKWLLSFYFVEFFFNLKELLLPQDVGCMLMNIFDTGSQWNIRIISIFDLCFCLTIHEHKEDKHTNKPKGSVMMITKQIQAIQSSLLDCKVIYTIISPGWSPHTRYSRYIHNQLSLSALLLP